VEIDIRNSAKIFIVLYSLSGIALGLSIIIFLFTFQGDLSVSYLRIGTLMLAGATIFVAVITSCQEIENIGEKSCAVAFTMKWYVWNKENKQIFLALLINLMNYYKFQFTENISVNFELGVGIVKALYSMVSVLQQIK
ncbi:uncharacterized protein BDFB_013620, partial [Asbolus verrucosus]